MPHAAGVSLRIVASVLVIVITLGALVAWRPAPALTLALVVGLTAGIVAFFVGRANGPRGVPALVSEVTSVGIVVGGSLGLLFGRRRHSGEWPMRRDALWLVVLTPFAAAALLQAILDACPLYVTRGSGFCYYDFDLLGGWAAGVVFLFVADMLILAGLLWLSPGPRRD